MMLRCRANCRPLKIVPFKARYRSRIAPTPSYQDDKVFSHGNSIRSLAVGCGSRSHRRGSPVQRCRSAESKLYGLPGTLVGLRLLLQGDRDAEARFTLENPMSVAYPLHLEREIGRRWLHRFVPIHRAIPLDRPKHPNDIRPLPAQPSDRTDPLRKSELYESDGNEQEPGHRERGRHLMEF
jgi:hypothetical protein